MYQTIYLDYNATTPVDPRVRDAILPYFCEVFGNPTSHNHSYGWAAAEAIQKARKQAAELICSQPQEIFWTSGATESNNLALQGAWRTLQKQNDGPVHIISSQVEHKSILDVLNLLQNNKAEITLLQPNSDGTIEPAAVKNALRENTGLVSLFMGQNEIGTINPITEIGKITRENGILFHVDAAQSLGKIPIDVQSMNIDLLSASGHKMYAPKGVGLLFKAKSVELEPLLCGGKQEMGLRAGTQNVPGIVGMGVACSICQEEMDHENVRLKELQKYLCEQLLTSENVKLNGHPTERLSSNLSFSFANISPELFELHLGRLAFSSGSACSVGQPSYVLKALGHSDALARSTIRLGFGRFTTKEDIEIAADLILKLMKTCH